jgi:hypothetical protein
MIVARETPTFFTSLSSRRSFGRAFSAGAFRGLAVNRGGSCATGRIPLLCGLRCRFSSSKGSSSFSGLVFPFSFLSERKALLFCALRVERFATRETSCMGNQEWCEGLHNARSRVSWSCLLSSSPLPSLGPRGAHSRAPTLQGAARGPRISSVHLPRPPWLP